MPAEPTADQIWHDLLGGQFDWKKDRQRYGRLPAHDRCKNCSAPFDGIWAWYARRTGRGQFSHNPRFCNF
jgi:hypothetical protein